MRWFEQNGIGSRKAPQSSQTREGTPVHKMPGDRYIVPRRIGLGLAMAALLALPAASQAQVGQAAAAEPNAPLAGGPVAASTHSLEHSKALSQTKHIPGVTYAGRHVLPASPAPEHFPGVTFAPPHVRGITFPPHTAGITFPPRHLPRATWAPHTAGVTFPPRHFRGKTWPVHQRGFTWFHRPGMTWPGQSA